ncbi:hypothetical protein L0F51_09670 [Afifella sp. H1R]|uniref:DUF6634 family protein n=1 Tax=Afifella sp. H1R TaxID=2908841 RepID=UPI001F22266C|nr:DUF6634 family protein [Afifella sp. H1R]MCF1504030.1 hypothetical protein [Afifella sp. H1R]
MLILDHDGLGPHAARDVARVEALAADLGALHQGRIPAAQDLTGAPMIDRWAFVSISTSALMGHVTGHPVLGTREVLTSAVWVAAPDFGVVRTLSRYYRLGRAADATEIGS